MAVKGICFALLFVCLIAGTFAGRRHHRRRYHDRDHGSHKRPWNHRYDSDESDEEDDDDDKPYTGHHHGNHHGHHHGRWFWHSKAGIGVIIVVICVTLALIVLITCLIRRLRRNYSKGKVGADGKLGMSALLWSEKLVFKPSLSAGFGLMSEGFTKADFNSLVKKHQGFDTTDGAAWSMPLTKGKHVFEVTWFSSKRGKIASIGVGTRNAPIKLKGSHPLVGHDSNSWGLDVVGRRVLHANRALLTSPNNGSQLPDRFYMYVNVDDGILGFGDDANYWGDAITTLPKNGTPLYVMVGASKSPVELSVIYKGSAPDGENDDPVVQPPYHLPPLYSDVAAPPPTYKEVQQPGTCITIAPANPETPTGIPPPAYSSCPDVKVDV